MPYGRVALLDVHPGGLGLYQFPVNYSEEGEFGRRRNLERTASTNHVGVVRQQGDDGPLIITFNGVIFHADMHQKLINYFAVGRDRTVFFTDFEGWQYEVFLIAYLPTRVRTLRNPRDPSIPYHYWKYSMEMEVVNALSGPWAAVA